MERYLMLLKDVDAALYEQAKTCYEGEIKTLTDTISKQSELIGNLQRQLNFARGVKP